jgi:glycerophosphoryl diester phosphodiesterase
MKFLLFTSALAMVQCPIMQRKALVVGHRGSPSNTPEHTLTSYQLAIDQGADYVEPDLVITKDGHFVARHENEISGTTNVDAHPEFASRKTTKSIDGVNYTGWFTEDFTLAEIKTLRAKERIPNIRPNNTRQDNLYLIPTLQEVIDLVRMNEKKLGKKIGIYPETKHPSYFKSIGLPFEDALLRELNKNGYRSKSDLVMIQSFEVWNLKYIRTKSPLYLVQLVDAAGEKPFDFVLEGRNQTTDDMLTKTGLAEIATYADAVSPYKEHLIPRIKNQLQKPTALIQNAHDAGLAVHTWTMRPENAFLPDQMKSSETPTERGDSIAEIRAFVEAGIDGFFTDSPDYGRAAVDGVQK